MSTAQSKWFSANPDKAWAEKLFLSFTPVFIVFNLVVQKMGWLDTGNFWNVVQNLAMWIPYLVLLPWWLRRRSGFAWRDSYWFKVNIYMAVYVFFATYFHTEWFFSALGLRYHFPNVSWYFDSALAGPDQVTALAQHQRIPLGMYFNTMAFFIVYHTLAVILMRRIRALAGDWGLAARKAAWFAIVLITSIFFAWAETFFYITPDIANHVYYVDKEKMLAVGTSLYVLYLIVSFPNFFRLDETIDTRWSLKDCVVQASFVSMWILLLIDLWVHIYGRIT
ncbi:cycloeucalenol cycloisomerase [Steroidobacter denitrificans]|uniref:Cycloeucalenol cycloisomerase n=1 Tax=Steroidobacter denitrificans TaxID=465721 RepID=A0A127FC51_STEDE|nr:hypothetical protein [Steroidobacter denitrificans]AMN47994.1 cycloeucalenol cycloisomerase [Steroidobacter denitrificans]